MTTQTNVDPQELRKFDAVATRWWDPEGECKPLHQLNPVRLRFIESQVSLSGKRVLDIGCGGGLLSEAMADRGALVTGIDMASSPLSVARLHLLESGLEVDYQQTSAEAFAELHPHEFDVITCMELLEHVPDPASLIKACALMLKPDGELFFSTLNRNARAFIEAIVGAEYVLKMLPKGNQNTFNITIDLPEGSTLEETDRVAREIGNILRQHEMVKDYETFVGHGGPIDFNGILRGAALFREAPHLGEIRVNLRNKHERSIRSEGIVLELREMLAPVFAAHPLASIIATV